MTTRRGRAIKVMRFVACCAFVVAGGLQFALGHWFAGLLLFFCAAMQWVQHELERQP